MNTGTQRSSATPFLAWTMNTLRDRPKEHLKKDLMTIMADHRTPSAATVTLAYPEDLFLKIEKTRRIEGTRWIPIFPPCPPGWWIPSKITGKIARIAVRSGVFPLYEIENGDYTVQEESLTVSVKEYSGSRAFQPSHQPGHGRDSGDG